jgi:hypothetical protein
MFAQTDWGAPLQGDALYLKQLVGADGHAGARPISTVKLLKAVALCELFGLPDCAAEVAIAYRQQLSGRIDVDNLLDLLTPDFQGRHLSYREYVNLFANNPQAFYPTTKKHSTRWAHRLRDNLKKLSSQ